MEKEKAEPEIKERIERGWKNNAYNEYVSDLISVHRSVGGLSLVGVCTDTVLSLVEIIVMLRQFSYAINTKLKVPKTPN